MEITDRFKQNIARHPEVPVLIALFALYMFLSNLFVWSLAFQDNYLNVSGGSDPYFNYYIVQYILSTPAIPRRNSPGPKSDMYWPRGGAAASAIVE